MKTYTIKPLFWKRHGEMIIAHTAISDYQCYPNGNRFQPCCNNGKGFFSLDTPDKTLEEAKAIYERSYRDKLLTCLELV